MKYFSMFSGIGGFELGIQRAIYGLHSSKKYEHEEKDCKCEGQRGMGINKTDGLVYNGNKKRAMDNKQLTEIEQDRERRNWDINEQGVCILPTKESTLCVGYSEIDKYAEQIYDKQFGGKNYGDATKINTDELPDFDLLVGGFPCQAFSIAGKRRGFEDTRGTLFFEIARIIKAKQPRLFLLENVKGLLNHNKGETFTTILQTIDELGYDVQWQVLNSKHFGVPQNRERVFIIGHLRGTSRPEVFPIRQLNEKNIKVIGELNSETWLKRNESIRRIYSTEGISPTITTGTGGGVMPKVVIQNTITQATGNRAGSSKEYLSHCQKVNETCGQIRRLTPIECERLQGFPDNWTEGLSDTQRYKCLGNAVTVNVIQVIIKKLLTISDE